MRLSRQPSLAFLAGLLMCGCDERVSDCADNQQWCKDFSLMPIGTVNRADPSVKVPIRFATENPTPSYEINFRVSIEQTVSGLTPSGSGAGLLPPSSLDSGWDIALSNPLPDLKAMKCGPAKLYLHARLRGTDLQTPLVPSSDPASASYRQHGVADFTVVDERPVSFKGKGQMAGGAALSNLALHDLGGQRYVFATLDEIPSTRPTQLGVGTLALQPDAIGNVSSAKNVQLVGETSPVRLLLTPGPGPMPCGSASAFLTACTQLANANDTNDVTKCFSAAAPFSWCFPAKSTAADSSGAYFSAIDTSGSLRVYNLTVNTGAKTLTSIEWTTGQFTGYRHVSIGDVDGDAAMDILALRQGGQPLILLREGQSFNQTKTKQNLAAQLAAGLAAGSSEAGADDAVATIGVFDNCDRRPDVLLASGGAVYVLSQQGDQPFLKRKLTLEQFPANSKITALLLADTDANGAADLLLVSIQPDTIYVYQVQ